MGAARGPPNSEHRARRGQRSLVGETRSAQASRGRFLVEPPILRIAPGTEVTEASKRVDSGLILSKSASTVLAPSRSPLSPSAPASPKWVTHVREFAARDLIKRSIAGSGWFESNWHQPNCKYLPHICGSRGLSRTAASPSAIAALGRLRNSNVQPSCTCAKSSLGSRVIAVSYSIRDSVKRF